MKKINKIFKWKYYDVLMVIIGSFIFSFGVNIFIVPNDLYNGGVLGIAQLIRSFLCDVLDINIFFDISGILYYLLNIPLFIIAYKYVNKVFFSRTLFSVSIQSLLMSIIPTLNTPVIDDILVNSIIGGILVGAGTGITLLVGASTGGLDIVGVVLSRKNNKFSVGKIGMFVNTIIYILTGILYGISTMIYSIIYSCVDSFVVDRVHLQNISSTAFIFCKKNPKLVNEFIKNDLGRDFTYWHAFGGYDDSRTYIIYTALSKYELQRLERFIKKLDDNIFIVKSEGVSINGDFKKNL